MVLIIIIIIIIIIVCLYFVFTVTAVVVVFLFLFSASLFCLVALNMMVSHQFLVQYISNVPLYTCNIVLYTSLRLYKHFLLKLSVIFSSYLR